MKKKKQASLLVVRQFAERQAKRQRNRQDKMYEKSPTPSFNDSLRR